MTDDPAAQLEAWAEEYREEPSLRRLLAIAEALSAPGLSGGAADPGMSPQWLEEQGELVAGLSAGTVRDNGLSAVWTAKELLRLRRALGRLGVPCGGWAVSEDEIAESILRYAKSEFRDAVTRMSPGSGWRVFMLWGEGFLPALGVAGDRDVITGYAIRHVRGQMSADARGTAPGTLRTLAAMLPRLDQPALRALRAAGIPTDEAGLEHAARVCEVRCYWRWFHEGGRSDHMMLAFVCAPVLAEETIGASEIGATGEEIWDAARAWAAGQVSRVEAGDYGAVDDLGTFADWSRLGHGPFGITADRVSGWERAQARERWTMARAGDGRAAFRVVCHCEDNPGSYAQVTGMPRARARAELQAVMTAYASRLRSQVETAASPAWARPPFEQLRDFITHVRMVNEHAAERDGRPLVDAPWEPTPGEWRAFYERYVAGD